MNILLKKAVFVFHISCIASATRYYAMQTIRNDGIGGRGITFVPKSGDYTNLVVWLHGLGDTADGWASMMPELKLDDTKFVLPTAKSRPIALNGGAPMPGETMFCVCSAATFVSSYPFNNMHLTNIRIILYFKTLGWSDIYGLSSSDREDKEGFDESAARVNQIVQQEIDKGVKPARIVIAGFSQGGAVAFHTALRSPHALGGVVALSTWVPLRADYPAAFSPAAAHLPILQVRKTALALFSASCFVFACTK